MTAGLGSDIYYNLTLFHVTHKQTQVEYKLVKKFFFIENLHKLFGKCNFETLWLL